MSAVCAIVTVLLIFAQPAVKQFAASPFYIAYSVALVTAGLFCAVFWKIVLPLFVLAYITIAAGTGVCLYMLLGAQNESFSLAVVAGGLNIDDFFLATDNQETLMVTLYTLPPALLLPLPRVWYALPAEEAKKRECILKFPVWLSVYMRWCLSDAAVVAVSLEPRAADYTLYTCTVNRSRGQLVFSVRQDM